MFFPPSKGKTRDSNTSHEKPFNKLYAVILCDINIVFMYGYTYKILLFNTQLFSYNIQRYF